MTTANAHQARELAKASDDPKLLKAAYNPKIVLFDKYNSRHEGD